MFNSACPTNTTRPSRAAPRYRLTGILIIALALLLGWGQIGSSGGASFTTARAAGSAPAYPLYAWGRNDYGQLGNGSTTTSLTPVRVNLPAGITLTTVVAGGFHGLAIGSDGKLYGWGQNTFGQLGNGSTTTSSLPLVVSLPAGVTPTAVAAGYYHSLVTGSGGKLYAWGRNTDGEIGDGSTTNSSTPVTISLAAGVTPTAITAGGYHSLAIGSDGKLYAWGNNSAGQLGNGTYNNSSTPVTVSLPAGVVPTTIAAGDRYSLAIGNNGKLYGWGNNQEGELGNGTTGFSSRPVTVSLPAGVTPTAITAGAFHSLAIGSDGKLYAWGYNYAGQLGNGSTTTSTLPVAVSLPAGVTPTVIAAGFSHSLAIGSDGKLYGWGENNYGQLGNGTASSINSSPLLLGSVAGITHPLLAAGNSYTLAVLALPSQVAATGGNPQSATVGTAFAAPLVATVRDVANNPVSSVVVTFTAPAGGATGTFAGAARFTPAPPMPAGPSPPPPSPPTRYPAAIP